MQPQRSNRIIIRPDGASVALAGARMCLRLAEKCVASQGFFTLALSGGSTPRTMHRLFAARPFVRRMPWQAVHLFWVDERFVAHDRLESNFGTACRDFVNHIPIAPQNVHPFPVKGPVPEAAAAFRADLETQFKRLGKSEPAFDLVFLGVGQDGHTASLFANPQEADNEPPWVRAVKGGDPHVWRLTLTAEVLNRAENVCFMVSGHAKASIVECLVSGERPDLPAAKIQPISGKLYWLMDRTAASRLLDPRQHKSLPG